MNYKRVARRDTWDFQLKKQVSSNEFKKCFRETDYTNCIASRHLDTYGRGCYYNCSYCYGKANMNSRGRWHPNNPAVASMENIAKQIKNHFPKGSVARLGGLSDCFQPIEKIYRRTYNTIRLLNKKKVHYLCVTKSPLVASQEYLDIYDPKLAHFQISITSTDNDYLKKISPRVPTFEESKQTIETLYDNGFDVIIRASPFFYKHMDYDKLNSIQCDKILIEFLYINGNINKYCGKYIDKEDYTFHQGDGSGYNISTIPGEKQIEIVKENITNFKEINICNGFPELQGYFTDFNCNSDFCCNLRGVTKKNAVRNQLITDNKNQKKK